MVDKQRELDEEEGEVEEATPQRKWVKPVIITVAVIVMMIVSFVITKMFVVPTYRNYQVKKEIEVQEQRVISDKEMGTVYIMEDFTVNTLGSNGRRYVIAEFAVEVPDASIVTELETKDPIIRDEFIAYFRGQTVLDVLDVRFQQKSRKTLMKILNKNLFTGQIDSLYYLKLLLQ